MVGLDAAGKTTILYTLKCKPTQEMIIMGWNLEKAKYKNLELSVFDLGGQEKTQTLRRRLLENIDGVIFMVDSQDKERGENAAEELRWVSSELAAEKPILIFANKQDLGDIMHLEEIKRILRLQDLKQKNWHIQPCCAIKGNGLVKGFDWINNVCQK